MCNRGSACRWRNGNNYLQFSIDFFFNIAINRQHILAYLRMISPWTAAQGCSRFVSYTDLLQSEESLCLLRYFILKWRHEKKKAPSEKREITQDFLRIYKKKMLKNIVSLKKSESFSVKGSEFVILTLCVCSCKSRVKQQSSLFISVDIGASRGQKSLLRCFRFRF